jgi:poly(3-hydroxybutyrate) depolymerase
MKTKRVLILMVLLATVGLQVYAQSVIGRQNVDQYPITPWGTPTHGLTWLPSDYHSSTTQYPLIIFLHGSGEVGDGVDGLNNLITTALPQKIAQGWDPQAVNPADGQNYQFIVISPQAPWASHWSYQYGHLHWILKDVINRYRIDTTRIYVTGLSAGGAGTWSCVTNGPEAARKFAAIVPIASAGVNNGQELDSIPSAGSQYGVKLWQICGALDSWNSFAVNSTNLYNGGTPTPSPQAISTALPGLGHEHGAWNTAYDPNWRSNAHNKNIYEWMLQYQRTSDTPAAPNQLPSANAGNDIITTLPADSVQLNGSGSDSDGTITSYEWKKISGPSGDSIQQDSSAQTWVRHLAQGTYHYELKVTDNVGASSFDTVMVTVNAAPVVNQLPFLDAGPDRVITLPLDSVSLVAAALDSDGSIATYEWSKISGPSSYRISAPTESQTLVDSLKQGVYQFRMTVTDSDGASVSDTVSIQVNAPVNNCNGAKIYFNPGPDGGQYITGDPTVGGWYRQVNPGDTLVLRAHQQWSYFSIENYQGTAACPIVITNQGGQVWMTAGIEIKNSHHIKITGTGSPNHYYGFKIYNPGNDGVGVAIGIQGKSKNVEVERIDVRKKTYGVWAKQDPLCDPSFNYPNYTMENIEVHHCRFRNIGQDCIYAGNTDPTGNRDMYCNGQLVHYIPMRLSNISIHHNIIDSVNRTGIQVSGADQGYNEVYSNVIRNCGYELDQQQGTGISIGGMTKNCRVYNNQVTNTFLYGILSFGAGINYIENNVVDSSGWLGGSPNNVSMPSNILLSTRHTIPFDSSTIIIRNNRLGKNATPDGNDIYFAQWGPPTWTANSVVCGNTKLDGTTPALVYVPSGIPVKGCDSTLANIPPVADAGQDQTIQEPSDSVSVAGTGSDGDGTIASYLWTKIAGPGSYSIANPDSAQTAITGLVPGTYSFRLTVTDNRGGVSTDDMEVKVLPLIANIPPVSNAGPDHALPYPVNMVSVSGSGSDADGSVTSYQWMKVAGPAQYTIESVNTPNTVFKNLAIGTYQFELTVVDNEMTMGKDTVKITVAGPPNVPPVVNAGPDQSITGISAHVPGSATDSDGSVVSYAWSFVSGPSSWAIGSPNAPVTTIVNLVPGVYVFRLKATDNEGASASDDMQITVSAPPPPNQAPSAHAGSDQTIALPVSSVTLSGSGADVDGTIASYLWEKISGPASYHIVQASAAQTVIDQLSEGVYQFKLTVTDNDGASSSDVVNITVEGLPNVPPVVNAGPDQNITGISAHVPGSATDSDGSIVSYGWSFVSGPSSWAIGSPDAPVTTIANLVPGVYVFRLTATDNEGASSGDEMQITVAAPNQAPSANAGSDQTITLPLNSITLNGSGADADGSVSGYSWTKISGPAQFSIAQSAQAQTGVNQLAEGVYAFQLTITDNEGAVAFDTVVVTVLPEPANILPSANAGTDILIALPQNSVTLSGSGSDADGTIVSYLWEKISGPAQYNIAQPNNAQTSVGNLIEGDYQFRLTVTDNRNGVAYDTVEVAVDPDYNFVPIAHAGANITITLPVNTAALHGNGVDPDGSIAGFLWSLVSGPSSYSIANPTHAQTAVTGLVEGVYVFQLAVTDNEGETGTDTKTITVLPAPANQLPVVNAGNDQTITLPVNSAALSATASDPDGNIVSYQWSVLPGSPSCIIASASSAQTQVNALQQGVYRFRVEAADNSGAIVADTVSVTVLPAPVNTPPAVNAGNDISITLPANSVQLQGSGSDADGSVASFRWTKISGPASYLIVQPGSPQTHVSALVPGVYVFRLEATDNEGAAAYDEVTVTVQSPVVIPNLVPLVHAGPDRALTLPQNSIMLLGSASDPDGTIASYRWSYVSGPSQYQLTRPFAAYTAVSNLVQGTYRFQLTVTDNRGAVASDTMMLVVSPVPVPHVNLPPVALAGDDKVILLPSNYLTLQGSGADPDGTVSSYRWKQLNGPTGNNLADVQSARTTIQNLAEGLYEFELMVTDNEGATATDTVNVMVKKMADRSRATVYPNPARDVVTVEIDAATHRNMTTLAIYDQTGKLVHSESFMRSQSFMTKKVNISHLPQGTYFFEISADINTKITCKVIKM